MIAYVQERKNLEDREMGDPFTYDKLTVASVSNTNGKITYSNILTKDETYLIYNIVGFSPDGKYFYHSQGGHTSSSRWTSVHSVSLKTKKSTDIGGRSLQVISEPLEFKYKDYLENSLKFWDWRIRKVGEGPKVFSDLIPINQSNKKKMINSIVQKALDDKVMGWLYVYKSLQHGPDDDTKEPFYKSWPTLISPDLEIEIPLGNPLYYYLDHYEEVPLEEWEKR